MATGWRCRRQSRRHRKAWMIRLTRHVRTPGRRRPADSRQKKNAVCWWFASMGRGVPHSRPRRRGSALGSVPCPVRRHLCSVLGMRCMPGSRTPAPALGAPRKEPIYPPALGSVHASTSATCSASLNRVGRPPSWSAGSACRPHVAAGRGRPPGVAGRPPAAPGPSSVRSAAAGIPADLRRPQHRPPT